MEFEIPITERSAKTKGEVKKLRREHQIPICIYSKGKHADSAALSLVDYQAVMREIQPGFLPTTVFALKDSKGKKRKMLVKEVQYKPTTYDVIHLDFLELHDDTEIDVKVPIIYLNQIDCIGEKLGGFLRSLMRHLKVRCLPKNMPSHFAIDVRDLNVNQFRRVSDLAIPAGVKPLVKHDEIVVSVLKV